MQTLLLFVLCRHRVLLYSGIIITPIYFKCSRCGIIRRTIYMNILSNMYVNSDIV